jgi:hypothetical protein
MPTLVLSHSFRPDWLNFCGSCLREQEGRCCSLAILAEYVNRRVRRAPILGILQFINTANDVSKYYSWLQDPGNNLHDVHYFGIPQIPFRSTSNPCFRLWWNQSKLAGRHLQWECSATTYASSLQVDIVTLLFPPCDNHGAGNRYHRPRLGLYGSRNAHFHAELESSWILIFGAPSQVGFFASTGILYPFQSLNDWRGDVLLPAICLNYLSHPLFDICVSRVHCRVAWISRNFKILQTL